MNVGAFVVLTQLSGYGEGARTLDDFTGLALRRPGLAALLAFFLLSLIGIPFTGGFFRQVLRLLRRPPRRPRLARRHWPAELRRRLLLLPAPARRGLRPPTHRLGAGRLT